MGGPDYLALGRPGGSRCNRSGEGGPLPLSGTPVAEVNTLMAELRETAAKRQAAERLLRDSERNCGWVTDNAPVAIAHCDTEAPL